MKHFLYFCLLWVALASVCKASPDFPVEDLCQRAETILIARVISVNAGDVTFRRVEQLRGQTGAKFVLQRREFPDRYKAGAEFLLISQGDAKYGSPPSVMGNPLDAQICWCGWLPYEVERVGDQIYVARVFSFADGELSRDEWPGKKSTNGLSLARIKGLVKRFAYNSQINDRAR